MLINIWRGFGKKFHVAFQSCETVYSILQFQVASMTFYVGRQTCMTVLNLGYNIFRPRLEGCALCTCEHAHFV